MSLRRTKWLLTDNLGRFPRDSFIDVIFWLNSGFVKFFFFMFQRNISGTERWGFIILFRGSRTEQSLRAETTRGQEDQVQEGRLDCVGWEDKTDSKETDKEEGPADLKPKQGNSSKATRKNLPPFVIGHGKIKRHVRTQTLQCSQAWVVNTRRMLTNPWLLGSGSH